MQRVVRPHRRADRVTRTAQSDEDVDLVPITDAIESVEAVIDDT